MGRLFDKMAETLVETKTKRTIDIAWKNVFNHTPHKKNMSWDEEKKFAKEHQCQILENMFDMYVVLYDEAKTIGNSAVQELYSDLYEEEKAAIKSLGCDPKKFGGRYVR